MKVMYTPVTHVIFDLDGLLLDTEHIYKDVICTVLARYGKTYSEELQMRVLGTLELDTARIITSSLNLPISIEDFDKELKKLQRDLLGNGTLMKGAEKLIRHFHSKGVPLAVATSSSEESMKLKLKNFQELFSCIGHFVMGSSDPEVKRGKPNPDIFLITAKRFKDSPPPEKCLVFEDAPSGVLGARAANMQVVMVPDKFVTEEKRKPATLVLNSLEDFKPELFGLPPF